MKVHTASADATRAVAAALAAHLAAGDVIVLVGDLGAGKTTFAQGIARGLGVPGPVTSPTFTLVQQYTGRVPVAHVDIYRLDRIQELHDLGFEELLDGPGVTLIEWGDAIRQVLPVDHAVVRIEPGDSDDERVLTFEFEGARWRTRDISGPLAREMSGIEGAIG
ncbi:MAG: tRNA (adenosine(37)-N6)-threonylcarbamoyltransferase complex ATPase subunit type 1 TsaE [Acidimicrobiia bacterium]